MSEPQLRESLLKAILNRQEPGISVELKDVDYYDGHIEKPNREYVSSPNDKGRHEITVRIRKDSDNLRLLLDAIAKVIPEGELSSHDYTTCIRAGDEHGYEDELVLTARCRKGMTLPVFANGRRLNEVDAERQRSMAEKAGRMKSVRMRLAWSDFEDRNGERRKSVYARLIAIEPADYIAADSQSEDGIPF